MGRNDKSFVGLGDKALAVPFRKKVSPNHRKMLLDKLNGGALAVTFSGLKPHEDNNLFRVAGVK
jgi:hypothetical protein